MYVWDVMIVGPASTIHEEAYYKAQLRFPKDFPNQPPEIVFRSEMWHPNIYPDGKVCISILHPPGTDKFNEFESAEERLRHALTHLPFRSWCGFCVQGRAKDAPHWQGPVDAETSGLPIVPVAFLFMSATESVGKATARCAGCAASTGTTATGSACSSKTTPSWPRWPASAARCAGGPCPRGSTSRATACSPPRPGRKGWAGRPPR